MSLSNFSALLEEWEEHVDKEKGKIRREVSFYASDEVKLRALTEIYDLPFDEVVASLLHHAILEVEEKMPYVAGDKVIRVEEGSDVYEDVGPMSRYLEAQKRLRRQAG